MRSNVCPGLGNQNQCGDLDTLFKPQMQAIMAVVIDLMVCIFLEFIGMNFGTMVCNVFGLLVLGLSIALIALVSTLPNFHRGSMNYKLTNTNIGVLVVASLLILFELGMSKQNRVRILNNSNPFLFGHAQLLDVDKHYDIRNDRWF